MDEVFCYIATLKQSERLVAAGTTLTALVYYLISMDCDAKKTRIRAFNENGNVMIVPENVWMDGKDFYQCDEVPSHYNPYEFEDDEEAGNEAGWGDALKRLGMNLKDFEDGFDDNENLQI